MSDERLRIKIFAVFVCFAAVMVSARLAYLQIYKGSFHKENAFEQARNDITIVKDRGIIFDRNGNELAINRKASSLYIFGRDISDRNSLIRKLRKSGLNLSDATVNSLKKSDRFIWVARNIDPLKAEHILRLVPELKVKRTDDRVYPQRQLAAQLVGFTGDYGKGRWGIEHRYEAVLKGEKIQLSAMMDSRRRMIVMEDQDAGRRELPFVRLSIDSYLQWLSESLLLEDKEKFKAEKGIAVAMDVETGEILFAASSEGFDPNNYKQYKPEHWKDNVSGFLFEPGSIMKPITLSALLESENIDLNKYVDCGNGKYKVYGHTFSDVHSFESLTVEDVIVKSSNVGIIRLSERLKNKDMYQFLAKMGLGRATGVKGVAEQKGLLSHYKKWSGLSKPSISMGQELYVTPLQVVRLYAALANGGFLKEPVLVKETYNGEELLTQEGNDTQVISYKTSEQMKKILRRVVLDGTGQNAKSDYLAIAGKTGTAQKFDNKTGKYSEDSYVASFAGFFPADNPKVAMVVIYDSPQKSIYGGSTAAVTFKKLAELVAMKLGYKKVWINEDLPAS